MLSADEEHFYRAGSFHDTEQSRYLALGGIPMKRRSDNQYIVLKCLLGYVVYLQNSVIIHFVRVFSFYSHAPYWPKHTQFWGYSII